MLAALRRGIRDEERRVKWGISDSPPRKRRSRAGSRERRAGGSGAKSFDARKDESKAPKKGQNATGTAARPYKFEGVLLTDTKFTS